MPLGTFAGSYGFGAILASEFSADRIWRSHLSVAQQTAAGAEEIPSNLGLWVRVIAEAGGPARLA